MSPQSAWRTVPHDQPARADWAGRARYAPSDFITLLWRERGLMLGVFLLILVLGLGFALTLKKSYTASSSILIQLGQEYVYEPRAGGAGRGPTLIPWSSRRWRSSRAASCGSGRFAVSGWARYSPISRPNTRRPRR